MDSLSFDSMATLYEQTRTFDPGCFESALDFLTDRFPPEEFRDLIYPGIGPGRIAAPLAERGYAVTGVDISDEMLQLLKNRVTKSPRRLPITFRRADATALPFRDGAFHLAVAVHLFYFIRRWRQAVHEILRVIRDDGAIVLMHTGGGTEIPFLNDRYKELCAEQGYPTGKIGVSSTTEVVDYLTEVGCRIEWMRDRWQWTSRIGLDAALSYLRGRAYSFTVAVPDEVHSTAVARLAVESLARFGDRSAEIEVPNQIYLVMAVPVPVRRS